jgi:alcohol dehydrogenase (NADP+)
VEIHPYLTQEPLVEFCKENSIMMTAYCPLGGSGTVRELLSDPLIVELAKKYNTTTSQIMLAWGMKRGYAVIPKSSNPQRLKENFDATKIDLLGEDVLRVSSLNKDKRSVDPSGFWGVDLW